MIPALGGHYDPFCDLILMKSCFIYSSPKFHFIAPQNSDNLNFTNENINQLSQLYLRK